MCSRSRCFGARLGLWSLLLSLTSASIAAGQPRGVGSRGTPTGPSVASPRTGGAAPTTGAKLGDSPLATVSLLGNDLNRCVDGIDDCRIYRVAQTEADPEIAYAGEAIVQRPTLLSVFMAREDDHNLLTCLSAGLRQVEWFDVVERGRTVANPDPSDLQQVFEWAQGADLVSTRYRLIWCPTTGDPKPFGQSWRLRVEPRSLDPLRAPSRPIP
jgi:hypothetical protein